MKEKINKNAGFKRYPIAFLAVFLATVLSLFAIQAVADNNVITTGITGLTVTYDSSCAISNQTDTGFDVVVNGYKDNTCNDRSRTGNLTFTNGTDADIAIAFDYTATRTGGSSWSGKIGDTAMKDSDSVEYLLIPANGKVAMTITSPSGDGTSVKVAFTNLNTASAYAGYVPAEADDADALAAKVVKFNGYDWYLIEDNSTSATEGTVTLLAKECVGASAFGTNNTYSSSTVETYVNNWYTSNISTDAKAAVDGNGMFLLTTDQARALSSGVRKCDRADGAENNLWWLCTPFSYYLEVACVDGDYGVVRDGVDDGTNVEDTLGVRPALNLDLSKVEFDSATNTFALPAPHTHDDITFTAWTSTDSLPTEAGNYYLTNNIVLEENWEVPEGTTNLCLNGKSVTTTEDMYMFIVGTWSDSDTTYALNLFDDTGEGFISKESSTNYSDCVLINENGNFTMNIGKITNSNGTAVYVNEGGKFTMNGGEISHNSGYIGGVYVPKGAEFTMNGGEITGNQGVEFGGVYVEGGYADPEGEEYCRAPGKFSVSGKVNISGNTVGTNECNVFLGQADGYKPGPEYNSVITLTGALDEDSVIGVTMIDSGVFTAGFDGKGAITNFTSDDSTYIIKTQGKELKLSNHEHSFSYKSSNGTITATCNGAGTCSLTDNKVSFTLTAPTNLVYDGTDKKATLEGVEAFNAATGLNVSADDIVYNDLTNVVTETKNAGTYQALYTLQTDFPRPFVGITFKIAKANPTYEAPKGIYAAYDDTLADVALPDGWAWVDDTTSVGSVGTHTFKANFTPADTTNYNTVENVDVTVKVNKADITPIVTLEGWTYGQEPNEPSVTGNTGNGDVAYTYAEKGSEEFRSEVPTEIGEYTVKAEIAETENYNGAVVTADFAIVSDKEGWLEEDGGWRYYENGEAVKDWKKLNEKWYYFDEDGVAAQGWKYIDGYWYYFNICAMQTGWRYLDGEWYYLRSSGTMATGWQKIDGDWYYFNSNGTMATGWVWSANSSQWYYLKSNGAMATGWIYDNGNWYYLNSWGGMRTDNLTYKGKVYRFASNGACLNP